MKDKIILFLLLGLLVLIGFSIFGCKIEQKKPEDTNKSDTGVAPPNPPPSLPEEKN